MAAETKETYKLTVTRQTRGEWGDREYQQQDDGSHKWVEVTKPREKTETVFVYEVPHEPDVEGLVRHMESKRKQG